MSGSRAHRRQLAGDPATNPPRSGCGFAIDPALDSSPASHPALVRPAPRAPHRARARVAAAR
ncbi:ubiquinol oxidase [Burkholderia thailandensis]|nr:ubiquinol oxidase [Burkholderia thailandensis]AVR29404.1 ubiquinol oxidase [Burkholderia thailandensis]MDD1482500.1 ubiquinol oxidase [Burkholderia thailandensis]MDD1486652.1 ubiquinol oxidase [Burkholderia thailandensis]MDD1492952.1 ubiquinol oxidase [Burkholderia thailandensis]